MTQTHSVALLIETSNSYARGVLDGIARYVRLHERWSIYLPEQERGGRPPAWLSDWKGDGVIARVETNQIAAMLRETDLPVVDVSAARHLPEIPWVETNDEAIAQMAAEHLMERGFQNMAFCGAPDFNWSNWRKQYFSQIVKDEGRQYFEFDSVSQNSSEYSWSTEQNELVNWLKGLPRPVGIFACYDIKARALLDACRELEIAVPEEVAVLGVDNDHLLCELADPPLSSIRCNSSRAGFEAAHLLDRMMAGESVESNALLIEPIGVETRQSTDILAIDDPEIAHAVSFIRKNAYSGINVNDILQEIPISRRAMEHRFQKLLGRTPHQEIFRLKIGRVKNLLTETDLSLFEISHSAGFQHEEYLSVAFKKAVGIPPSEYRRKHSTL